MSNGDQVSFARVKRSCPSDRGTGFADARCEWVTVNCTKSVESAAASDGGRIALIGAR